MALDAPPAEARHRWESRRTQLNNSPLSAWLKLECLRLDDQGAAVRMRTTAEVRHDNGAIPGALVSALADAAASFALFPCLAEGESHATTDLSLHFVRALVTDAVVAEARVLRRAQTIAFASARLLDDEGRLCATATGTWAITRARHRHVAQPPAARESDGASGASSAIS
jgi:uncharacterized protein (TIGR00369 family)